MTCPHCGFLMSPLDADCARCRHRGYVPPSAPTPDAQHPALTYSYSPLPPAVLQLPPPSRTLEVVACWMSVTALFGLMLFGMILRERRSARQQAEIAALQQQLAEVQQSQTSTQVRVVSPQPPIINVEVRTPSQPIYVPAMPVYPIFDPVAERGRQRQEFMLHQQRMQQQQTDNMILRQNETMERMHADMQRMRDRMESIRQPSQPRIHDPRDPFNPYGRF